MSKCHIAPGVNAGIQMRVGPWGCKIQQKYMKFQYLQPLSVPMKMFFILLFLVPKVGFEQPHWLPADPLDPPLHGKQSLSSHFWKIIMVLIADRGWRTFQHISQNLWKWRCCEPSHNHYCFNMMLNYNLYTNLVLRNLNNSSIWTLKSTHQSWHPTPQTFLLWRIGPGHAEWILCHTRTTKVQISLRIRAVWSAPLLFAA